MEQFIELLDQSSLKNVANLEDVRLEKPESHEATGCGQGTWSTQWDQCGTEERRMKTSCSETAIKTLFSSRKRTEPKALHFHPSALGLIIFQ